AARDVDAALTGGRGVPAVDAAHLDVEAEDLDRLLECDAVPDGDAVVVRVAGELGEGLGGDLGADADGVAEGEGEDGRGAHVVSPSWSGRTDGVEGGGGARDGAARTARVLAGAISAGRSRHGSVVSVSPTSPPLVTMGSPACGP